MAPAERLLGWYDRRGRDLPWRHHQEPYAVWVSEIMLQQTRAEAVLSYYDRFLKRFPSVELLAAASSDEVLSMWAGLGYYRRARLLHQAARQIVAAGRFPDSLAGLRALPGVGAYTAAAVASIAFDVPVLAIDGNVERVLTRQFATAENPRRAATRRRLEEHAAALFDRARPGDSNQALMELGATICRPRRPACWRCPISSSCRAHALGEAERFPVGRPTRRRQVKQTHRVAVVRSRGRTLLFRRPADSALMAGLWELPSAEAGGEVGPEEQLARRYGGRWLLHRVRGRVRHAITHRMLTLEAHEATLEGGAEELGEGVEAAWFTREELFEQPLSSMVWKVLDSLERGE